MQEVQFDENLTTEGEEDWNIFMNAECLNVILSRTVFIQIEYEYYFDLENIWSSIWEIKWDLILKSWKLRSFLDL